MHFGTAFSWNTKQAWHDASRTKVAATGDISLSVYCFMLSSLYFYDVILFCKAAGVKFE